jgi:hypothetical protein
MAWFLSPGLRRALIRFNGNPQHAFWFQPVRDVGMNMSNSSHAE